MHIFDSPYLFYIIGSYGFGLFLLLGYIVYLFKNEKHIKLKISQMNNTQKKQVKEAYRAEC